MRLADFIIGGAPRSGTTWLYQVLDRHPEIFMAKPIKPEPKFFLIDELYDQGIDYYGRTWFQDTGVHKVYGEKTTNYLEATNVAARIKRNLPNVKLIFVLREPVERAFSNYLWSIKNKMEKEDFETALFLEDKREKELPKNLRYSRPHANFSRGLYADLLKPYFDLFPREHILCLKFEDIVDSTDSFIKRVHKFLGVSPRLEDGNALGKINAVDRGDSLRMPDHIRDKLRKAYTEPNRRLALLLGPDFKIWEYHE
nr:sulfotransferase [Desulfobacula sp.]